MEIKISDKIKLSQIKYNDAGDLVFFMNDREIIKNTLNIPFPYTYESAVSWIELVEEKRKEYNFLVDWAIRYDGRLVGGISFLNPEDFFHKKGEIGYWIGKAYRNQKIMTRILPIFCKYGFDKFELETIEAKVFEWNQNSMKLLENVGFFYDRDLLNAFEKNKQKLSGKLYLIHKSE